MAEPSRSRHAEAAGAREATQTGVGAGSATALPEITAPLAGIGVHHAHPTSVARLIGAALFVFAPAQLARARDADAECRRYTGVPGATWPIDKPAGLATPSETDRTKATGIRIAPARARSIGEADLSLFTAGVTLLAGIGFADTAAAPLADSARAAIDRFLAVVLDAPALVGAGFGAGLRLAFPLRFRRDVRAGDAEGEQETAADECAECGPARGVIAQTPREPIDHLAVHAVLLDANSEGTARGRASPSLGAYQPRFGRTWGKFRTSLQGCT